MDHKHLRKEKICLNCGHIVHDKFCSHCGQLNTEPKESFGHLVGHFFEDVTHYDSQFITTIKDLIFKPGFLTREYIAGKRASYLNPIRMYIFISAVFFLVMFSQKKEENNADKATTAKTGVNLFRQHLADSLRGLLKPTWKLSLKDSARNNLYSSLAAQLDTSSKAKTLKHESVGVGAFIDNYGVVTLKLEDNKYKSVNKYNAEQRALPDSAKDGAIAQYLAKKIIRMVLKDGHNGKLTITQNIEHDIPKIVFLLLPLFALYVGFFYDRKKYFYSQQAIFSLHFHSFVFIAFLIMGLISLVVPMDKAWQLMIAIPLLVIFIYLAAALHNAYQEAIWLSAFKAVAISILYLISLIIGLLGIFAAIFILA